jgi:oligoribonuclease NrnB/cAMP/cGMP phosphodiesterase (DHH superfamily)
MLSRSEIDEIREHLDRASNPVFFYDNDADGLCSFLLFRKYLGRGKGVAIRSYPDIDESYAKKITEFNSDYVFVLDKPSISPKFFRAIQEKGIPLVWIDHHDVERNIPEGLDNLFVYNPTIANKKSLEPTTFLAYKIVGGLKWLAIAGCISDHYLPDFAESFGKENSEYWGNVKEPFDALYNTEIGKIAIALNFGLKDSTSNIVKFQNFLIDCENPSEIFEEVPSNYFFRRKYHDIKKKYDILLKKAMNVRCDKILFFIYGGDLSISAELSNELNHNYPSSFIVVGYKKGNVINLSLRGKNIKNIFEKILPELNNASGGGHLDAVGARISSVDLDKFKALLFENINCERFL